MYAVKLAREDGDFFVDFEHQLPRQGSILINYYPLSLADFPGLFKNIFLVHMVYESSIRKFSTDSNEIKILQDLPKCKSWIQFNPTLLFGEGIFFIY